MLKLEDSELQEEFAGCKQLLSKARGSEEVNDASTRAESCVTAACEERWLERAQLMRHEATRVTPWQREPRAEHTPTHFPLH